MDSDELFLEFISESVPEIVLINLDSDRTKALQLIGLLSNEHPNVQILAVSSDNQAILQALAKGAKFFLSQPVVLEELLTALCRLPSPAFPG